MCALLPRHGCRDADTRRPGDLLARTRSTRCDSPSSGLSIWTCLEHFQLLAYSAQWDGVHDGPPWVLPGLRVATAACRQAVPVAFLASSRCKLHSWRPLHSSSTSLCTQEPSVIGWRRGIHVGFICGLMCVMKSCRILGTRRLLAARRRSVRIMRQRSTLIDTIDIVLT